MNTTALVSLALTAGLAGPLAADLEINNTEGKHIDIVSGEKVLVRYMYEHDTSSEERHHETYKPYLHVFDAEGKKPITKGAGGQFTHHRGIFLGWNKLQFKGKSYDRWHMKGGDIVHQNFLNVEGGKDRASIVAMNHWNDAEEKPLLDEVRTMNVQVPAGGPARLVINFESRMTAKYGTVELKGDPEHAGVQYRPANEVDKKATKYLFPEEKITAGNVKAERDLPWIAETYVLDGKMHSVVQLNHPGNPKETRHSAYRDYGRFGCFFEAKIEEGETLVVKYRFLIMDGELPERSVIDKAYAEYAGK